MNIYKENQIMLNKIMPSNISQNQQIATSKDSKPVFTSRLFLEDGIKLKLYSEDLLIKRLKK